MSVLWPKELYGIVYDYLPFSDQLQIASGATKISPEDKRYHEIFAFFQSIVNAHRHSIHQFLSALEKHNAWYIKKLIVAFATDESAEQLSLKKARSRLEMASPPFAKEWPDNFPINFYLRYQRIFQYYREYSLVFKRAFEFPTLHCIGYGYLRIPNSTFQPDQVTALNNKNKQKQESLVAETARILSDAGLTCTKALQTRAKKDEWLDILPEKKQGSVMCIIM